jgi:benzoate-CoA ligase family protein
MPTAYNACVDLLDRNVEAGFGDRPAVMSREQTVTYAQLLDGVTRTARGLTDLGLRPEQRVAMVMLDSIEFHLVFLGTMRIGAVPVPLNALLPGRDLGEIVAASRATLLVVSAERSGEVAAISAAAPEVTDFIVVGSAEWDGLLAEGEVATPYASWDESPGFWLCTSGSTGAPKLAMHRHADLRASFDTYATEVLAVSAEDRCYSVGPMFHAYGLGNSLTFPLMAGASAVVEPTRPPSAALIADVVRKFRPTLFFCLPTVYAALLASDVPDNTFGSVRYGISAAEPLPADIFHRFRDRFGVEILDGIGSTEMTHIFVSNWPGDIRPGTSGRPVPGYDVALLDDDGDSVSVGALGHLYVGGASMATGYWCASGPSRRAFQGERMRTGDMYVRSSDGYYTYLGRSDDMLRVGGEWVSPAQVEAVLVSHAGVLEAAVVGERDELGVQRPVAYVVASPGTVLDIAELEVWCKAELAGYKRPRRFEVVVGLPKTATGKIQRYKLRSRLPPGSS